MKTDRRGLPVTTCSPRALELYDDALDLALARRDGAVPLLEEALAEDEHLAVAWALLSAQHRTAGKPAESAEALQRATALADGLTDRERSHVRVLQLFAAMELPALDRALTDHLAQWPRDALVLVHGSLLYNLMDWRAGRDERLLALVEQAAPASAPDDWFFLAARAFALEEVGAYGAAGDLSRQSLELHPMNGSAAHSLAHVLLETGASGDGERWLGPWLGAWDQNGNAFACHLVWHLALFDLAEGDEAAACGRLRDIEGFAGASIAPLMDGGSLAWRLSLDGAEVSAAWEPLAALENPPGVVFANLHHALVLAGLGDAGRLRAYAASVRSTPASSRGYPMAGPLAAWCDALAAWVDGDAGTAATVLLELESSFRSFGGSRAQTEVMEDTLIAAVAADGRTGDARRRLEARLARRGSVRDERWLARLT